MKKLNSSDFEKLFKIWQEEGYEIYAPRRAPHGGDFFFNPVKTFSECEFDGFVNTLKPPKDFFFPQEATTLKLYRDRLESQEIRSKKVIFGIRPCDLEGLLILDQFYLGNITDPFYKARRENTLLVTFACFNPAPTCFCKEADAGPVAKRGYDIQVFDLGDVYLVEAGSEAGEKYISEFPEADAVLKSRLEEENKKTLEKFTPRPWADNLYNFHVSKDSGIWRELSKFCLKCGGCNYLCPTCSCFNTFDLDFGEYVEQRREWDSCLLEGYHRMAGSNPKPDGASRFQFRFECKLSPEVNRPYGRISCTGCGRCIQTCIGDAHMESLLILMHREGGSK